MVDLGERRQSNLINPAAKLSPHGKAIQLWETKLLVRYLDKGEVMSKVTVQTGINETDQEGSFQNATLQGIGDNLAASIETRITVPPRIIEQGEIATSMYIKGVLMAAQNAVDGNLAFNVRMGLSRDAMNGTPSRSQLFLDIQAEADDDSLECTHFDQWPSDLWMSEPSIRTAEEVLASFAFTLGIPAIHPDVLAEKAGKSFDHLYIDAGVTRDYPGIIQIAIDEILKDGRYAVYASDNFVEVYDVLTIKDSLMEHLMEIHDDEEDANKAFAQIIERAEQLQAEHPQPQPLTPGA